MKKILDFLIIFLLVFLTINLFTGGKKEDETNGIVSFSTTDNSYTVPASVGLKIENKTPNNVKINTCDDINIKENNSGKVVKFSDDFCSDIEVKSNTTEIINYADEYDKFKEVGNYTFIIKYDGKEPIATFEIKNKGSFSKLFTTLLYAPMYNFMILLIDIFSGSLGFAIIAITITIRILLLWPQHKMMLSQKKLQNIQPKIKKIQEENKGNQQAIGMKLMELYKKEKVNPMGSCGFLLIQMPILLVIYRIILYIQDHSNYYHIYSSLASFDLTSISYNFFGIELLKSGGITGIILGISVGLIQFIQIKLSLSRNPIAKKKDVVLEKKKGANDYSQFMPDPEVMNKFMLYGMPTMVAIFTYTLIAGVGLYWGISTTFMIFQQIVVNKILKK